MVCLFEARADMPRVNALHELGSPRGIHYRMTAILPPCPFLPDVDCEDSPWPRPWAHLFSLDFSSGGEIPACVTDICFIHFHFHFQFHFFHFSFDI